VSLFCFRSLCARLGFGFKFGGGVVSNDSDRAFGRGKACHRRHDGDRVRTDVKVDGLAPTAAVYRDRPPINGHGRTSGYGAADCCSGRPNRVVALIEVQRDRHGRSAGSGLRGVARVGRVAAAASGQQNHDRDSR